MMCTYQQYIEVRNELLHNFVTGVADVTFGAVADVTYKSNKELSWHNIDFVAGFACFVEWTSKMFICGGRKCNLKNSNVKYWHIPGLINV